MAEPTNNSAAAKPGVLDGVRVLDGGLVLRHPVRGTALVWVHEAIDPGPKGKARSLEKLLNDYGGDVTQLKDIARITLIFADCAGLLKAVEMLSAQFEVLTFKNKFASPTPMGECFAARRRAPPRAAVATASRARRAFRGRARG